LQNRLENVTNRGKLLAPAGALLCLVLALAGVVRVARAGSLAGSVLGMFPKRLGEVGYADLKAARQASWFPQLEAQVLPLRFRRFSEFLRSSGINPDTQIEEVAWAGAHPKPAAPAAGAPATGEPVQQFTGEQIVGIALGSFTPDAVDQFFKKQKLPTVSVRGYTLYAFGSGVSPGDLFFFFFDSNTIAFGHLEILEALIGVRFGDEESFLQNQTLSPLVDEVNGQGTIWVALDKEFAHASMERMVPEVAQFPGAADLLARIKGMTATIQIDSGMDARITPYCGSTNDAVTLAQLLQAGLLYKRSQVAQSNPDMAKVIDATTVSVDGDHLKVRTQVSDELVQTLLKSGGVFPN
jgi:hypothetical protein